MPQERIIGLHEVPKYFNIVIQTPPPHRDMLGVNAPILEETLKTLRLADQHIQINFYRNEPRVNVAPEGYDHVSAATRAVVAESEMLQKPEMVQRDVTSDKLIMMLPYQDRQTQTPQATADHASRMLRKGFGDTPKVRYISDMLESPDLTEMSGKEIELSILVEHAVENVAVSLIVAGITHAMHGKFTIPEYLLTSCITYTGSCLSIYIATKNWRENPPIIPFHLDRAFPMMPWLIDYIAQHPKSILYPEILIGECLIPSIAYSVQRLTQKNLVVAQCAKS